MKTLFERKFHAWRVSVMAALAIVLALLMAACGSSSGSANIPPTRTPKPTFTVEIASPTPASSPTPVPTSTPIASPTPTVNPNWNPLTGKLVQDPAVLQRRPLLVRIGNDAEVRPQSGLSQADMVFEEAIEEFTGTRFTAVIWSKDPEILKPIRSARLLTIQLGYMFDAALVHSGANDQVRWLLSQTTLIDLDQYFNDEPYYWIEPTGAWKDYPWMGRTVTSAKRIRDYLAKKGKDKSVHLAGFTFSHEGDPLPQGQTATYIHIPYPKKCLVEWYYDAENHVYKRVVRGEPHTDAINGEQLTASNVILHYSKYEKQEITDANGVHTFDITFTGEGRAQICRDGVIIEAKWIRTDKTDFVKYQYLDGSPVPLRPGQTWIEVVPPEYQITYKAE